jgi:hypothetical protein
MEKIAIDGPKPPIGFLSSVWKGIEYVNAHPGVLAIPVLLDSFLWFGPHLSVYSLVKPAIDSMASTLASNPEGGSMVDVIYQVAKTFNLFSLLSFLPLFPPSLMAGAAVEGTPLGNPVVLTVPDWLAGVGLAAGLILCSLLIGSAFWVWAGSATRDSAWGLRDSFRRWTRAVLMIFILCAGCFLLFLVIAVPLAVLISLIAVLSPGVGAVISQVFVFLSGGLIFWVVLFFMFSMHGTILFSDDVPHAVWNSINTSRWMYPVSIWIPLLLILLNFLASSIWSLAPSDSWSGVVGIVGNAYTSSVVVVASMAYYSDKRRWIGEVRDYLQSRMAGSPPTGAA